MKKRNLRIYESLPGTTIERDLSDPNWPAPNLTYLRNALQQTGWDGPVLDEENWRNILWQRLEGIDWKKVITDVRPFLENVDTLELLTQENFFRLLHR